MNEPLLTPPAKRRGSAAPTVADAPRFARLAVRLGALSGIFTLVLLLGLQARPEAEAMATAPATATRVQHAGGPDGMPLLLAQREEPLLSFSLSIRSGSAYDPPDRSGLAYVSARALLWGVGDWRDFDDRLADLGARLELKVEQSTIVLRGEVLARYAEPFFALLGEVFAAPPSSDEVFAKLLSETRMRQQLEREDDRELAFTFFKSFVHQGEPLGNRPMGSAQSLQRIALADVQRFWSQHFVPSNMILAVGGAMDMQGLQRLAAQTWPARGVEAPVFPERQQPQRMGRRVLLVDKPARSQNEIFVGHAVPSPSDPSWPAFEVALAVLGGNFSSRLVRELRMQRQLTYDIKASRWRNAQRSIFYVATFSAPDRAVEVIRAILSAIELLQQHGATQEELELARDYVAGRLVLSTDNPHALMRESARLLRYGLGHEGVARLASAIAAVELGPLNAVISTLIKPRDLCIVMLCSAEHFGEALLRIEEVPSVVIAGYDEE